MNNLILLIIVLTLCLMGVLIPDKYSLVMYLNASDFGAPTLTVLETRTEEACKEAAKEVYDILPITRQKQFRMVCVRK